MFLSKKKTLKFYIIIILLMSFSIVAWFYPYSFLSVQKMITYNADNLVIQKYIKELDELREINEKNPWEDLIKNRTTYVLQMYEQNWLTSKKSD